MNLRQAQTAASALLSGDESLRATAGRDAELLLLHTLQVSRAALLAHPERKLTASEQALYQSSLDRRLRQEPIQYILGEQEFYGLTLRVTPAVLIPRPETEHLVEAVLQLLPAERPLRIADVGTGSGAIAIALAVHLPRARITAIDLSVEALAVAGTNVAAHNLLARIRLLHSDLLAGALHETGGEEISGDADAVPGDTCGNTFLYDAIVSNPPYIPDSERDTLHPQVRDHEPSGALFAGPGGLDVYRRLIPEAWAALKPNGLLALEIGHGQNDAVSGLLSGWNEVSVVDDLQRIPRVVIARKPPDAAAKA